jgi:hypothetical protein
MIRDTQLYESLHKADLSDRFWFSAAVTKMVYSNKKKLDFSHLTSVFDLVGDNKEALDTIRNSRGDFDLKNLPPTSFDYETGCSIIEYLADISITGQGIADEGFKIINEAAQCLKIPIEKIATIMERANQV